MNDDHEIGAKCDPENGEVKLAARKMPAQHSDHVKWLCDGAKTMGEVAQALRGAADYFERLARQDATLTQPVDGGYIFYLVPGHEVDVRVEIDSDGTEYADEDDVFEPCPVCHKTG